VTQTRREQERHCNIGIPGGLCDFPLRSTILPPPAAQRQALHVWPRGRDWSPSSPSERERESPSHWECGERAREAEAYDCGRRRTMGRQEEEPRRNGGAAVRRKRSRWRAWKGRWDEGRGGLEEELEGSAWIEWRRILEQSVLYYVGRQQCTVMPTRLFVVIAMLCMVATVRASTPFVRASSRTAIPWNHRCSMENNADARDDPRAQDAPPSGLAAVHNRQLRVLPEEAGP
jgi:hypothetical protein